MNGDSPPLLVSRRSLLAGLIGGLIHAAVAVVLWGAFGMDDLVELIEIKPLIGGYLLLGMFALGFVPVVLYVGLQLVSPAVVVGGLLLLSVVGSWLAGPVRAPASTPTPFGVYVLLWVGVVALAGLAGVFERKRRRAASG